MRTTFITIANRVTFLKDGVTVLRLISDNAGEMVASEVISDLWQLYKNDNKRSYLFFIKAMEFMPQ